MKEKRIVDKELLRSVSQMPCLVCNRYPSDPDHITTRGARGDDTPDNVWSLCRTHHQERHKIGLISLINKYPVLESWLLKYGREDILDRREQNG